MLTAATAEWAARESDPTLWLFVLALAIIGWAMWALLVRAVAVHGDCATDGAIRGAVAWAGNRRPGGVDLTLSLGTLEPVTTAARIVAIHEPGSALIAVTVNARDAAAFTDRGHPVGRLPGRLGLHTELTTAQAVALGN